MTRGGGPFLLLVALALAAWVLFRFDLMPQDAIVAGPDETFAGPFQPTPSETASPDPGLAHTVFISEIMASNRRTLASQDGRFPDWIELHHAGEEPLDLEGFFLSDSIERPQRWAFPQTVLHPGEYRIIFASGLGEEGPDGELHTSFRLSQDGESVVFSDPEGNVLQHVDFPALPPDLSYGIAGVPGEMNAGHAFLPEATPGKPNSPVGFATPEQARPRPPQTLWINEYVTKNISRPDFQGDLPDWAELHNAGEEAIDLGGYHLSDDSQNPFRWSFPEVTIEPGDHLVVWLSGKKIAYEADDPGTLHAPFALGAGDDALVLSDPFGQTVDAVPILVLPPNVSYGRDPEDPETFQFFPRPTPGRANDTAGFATLPQAESLGARGVYISEVSTIDSVRLLGHTRKNPDWIELGNLGRETVDLSGYGLSDQAHRPFRLTIPPETLLRPGEYLVFEPQGFGLSAGGETIRLTCPRDGLIDWLDTGLIPNGMSRGRPADPEAPAATRLFYEHPTPGEKNAAESLAAQALAPKIVAQSVDGAPFSSLYFEQELVLHLESVQPGAAVHYTLDGSLPDAQSPVFEAPLPIDATTAIRSRSFLPGALPSPVTSRIYLKTTPHDLPVVSLQLPPQDFHGAEGGLYRNIDARIERLADIQFYETDGTLGLDFRGGLALHGSFSRKEAQKSLQVALRALYGEPQIVYPFFEDSDVIFFRRLILRTSGQDWKISKLRDTFMTAVIQDHMQLDTMAFRHCVVYVNGEYFGLYALREKTNKHHYAAHHGADPEKVDVIKGNRIVLAGSMQAYDELLAFVRSHDMRDPDAYAHVLAQIDEASLMDFVIAQSFFSNYDSGNKKFWRERSDDGVWRWVFFDLDWALFPTTARLNLLSGAMLHPDGHGHDRIFDTTLQVRLMQNPDFEKRFIERYAWHLEHTFETQRMLSILDELQASIESEMPRQIERWGQPASVAQWEQNVAALRQITAGQNEHGRNILQNTFRLSDSQMEQLFAEDDG